jgi:tetratricopeptide (TPR) repeat protein
MAETTLQAYLRQLEDLLARDALDEVIAHCRHILERFPKNLTTYRLLGKAMLEKKRLQDASDIFQRILSAEPSDFVSHLGMSLVYQEEGSIDQAIWHMERAFEQSPNNPTLQEELRSLFRQRNGGEPAKLQLTRGALARLYAKGELYDQAIAELAQAIQESPDRLDLQTLLAETLWNSRQPVEAGQVAAQVLHRLPNCLQANRILAELWLEAGQSSEARPFLQRVEALDPYMALELESGGQPVPDDAVKLERLEWTTEVAATALDAPDWVRDLSIAFDQTGGQPVRATLPEIPYAPAEEPEQEAEAVTPPPPDTLGMAEPDWLGQSTEEPGPPVEEAPEPEPMPPSPDQPVPASQQEAAMPTLRRRGRRDPRMVE